jgi:hypothetical protein
LPSGGFAGRGISSKPAEDPQIEARLRSGRIEMPLWGVSLSPDVAAGFGTRFLFELVGDFPAVPAWKHSGLKDFEQELVTGGRYRVLSQEDRNGTTHVRLRWIGASGDRIGSDPLLVAVLGAVPRVAHSSLTRSAGQEVLELRLGGEDSATVTREASSKTVEVVRYWELDPGWDAPGRRRVQPVGRHESGIAADDGAGGRRVDRRRRVERGDRVTTTLDGRAGMGAGPLSERFDEALAFAAKHRRAQLRKGSRVPYMTHLMSVSALVLEHGGTEDQAIAGLLHDAVEDAPAGRGGAVLAEIRERFGDAVADMVAVCSDGLNDSGERKGTWQERSRRTSTDCRTSRSTRSW